MAKLALSSTGVFLLVIWLMSMVFVYILVIVVPYSEVLYSTLNGGDWKDGDALGLCSISALVLASKATAVASGPIAVSDLLHFGFCFALLQVLYWLYYGKCSLHCSLSSCFC
ncbi:hypothetical protein D5086_001614 [Populus alba]|uniref:Uncharacterized protein n=1 Tax=Populus alba TaxID=43335 RepID=A0ACC4D000_POPAL